MAIDTTTAVSRHASDDFNSQGCHGARQEERNTLHDRVLSGVVGLLLRRNLENGWEHLTRGMMGVQGVADFSCTALCDEDHGDIFTLHEFVKMLLNVLLMRLGVHNEEVLFPLPIYLTNACQNHARDSVLIAN